MRINIMNKFDDSWLNKLIKLLFTYKVLNIETCRADYES